MGARQGVEPGSSRPVEPSALLGAELHVMIQEKGRYLFDKSQGDHSGRN
jgi:hypothetical protein